MPGIDDKDKKILRILRSNGRITLTELGEKVNLSPASVRGRVKKLERLGAIRGYSAIVDQAFLDEYVSVFFELKLAIDDHTLDGILRRLSERREVRDLYRVSGESQIVIRANFRDNEEVKRFVALLRHLLGKNLEKVTTKIVLETFKESWIPIQSRRK
jgi:Lrp/AsnC family leucine-responsive transcriptional regulator